jgi:hypothetical protein
MSPIRYWLLPLLGALSLAGVATADAAKLSLAEAIKQANSKYLDVPPLGGLGEAQEIVAGGGEEQGLPPLDDEISEGPVRVTLTYRKELGPEDEVLYVPIVTVYFDNARAPLHEAQGAEPVGDATAPDEGAAQGEAQMGTDKPVGGRPKVAVLEGGSAADPLVSAQIAELDASNPYPEVVVSFFTGGAHCCSATSVVTSNADGSKWTTVNVGEFDGGPMIAVDLNGDGAYEFEVRDNAFLYAFGCYACSEAPLQVLALENGKIKDVSTDPRFQPSHAAWLKSMISGVPKHDVNGFLAGYVGEKIRLGEGKEAWDLMLKHYDRKADWGLNICDQELDENGECPVPTVRVTFPEALERMLNENGYKMGG